MAFVSNFFCEQLPTVFVVYIVTYVFNNLLHAITGGVPHFMSFRFRTFSKGGKKE